VKVCLKLAERDDPNDEQRSRESRKCFSKPKGEGASFNKISENLKALDVTLG